MADKAIPELPAVDEKHIQDLPQLQEIYDDTLIPVSQNNEAHKMTGAQFREFGESTAKAYVQTAVDAAETATGALDKVVQAGEDAVQDIEDKRQAAVTAMEEIRDTTEGYKDDAAQSVAAAAASETAAGKYAKDAQSYAVGGTQTRENEDVDNARYYYDQAKRISQGLGGALLPMGTVAFADLESQAKQAGYMYNISDAFTTTGNFNEGAGHAYPAGTNVYYTAEGKWDCLAGAQVVSVNGQTGAVTVQETLTGSKGQVVGFDDAGQAVPTDAYVQSVNGGTGAVQITPAGIGAYTKEEVDARSGVTSVNSRTGAVTLAKNDVGLGNVDNTADKDKAVAKAKQADVATNSTQLNGHPDSYFVPKKLGTSTMSFTDAARNAGISTGHGVDAIEKFVANVLPSIDPNTTAVISQAGNGPVFGIWYFVLTKDIYCGVVINYFASDLRMLHFAHMDSGVYAVREF